MSASRFEKAAAYAKALHATQRRKGTDIPYFTHLIGTAEIAKAHCANETEQIAALLHDAIEDQPREGKTAEEIRERFGEEVFSIVMGCTDGIPGPDGKKPPWKERKVAYIAHLRTAAPSVLLVSASDKLYNARSIVEDFKRVGPEVFKRFTASQQQTAWYYRELVKAFRDAGGPKALVDELEAVVTELERFAGAAAQTPSPTSESGAQPPIYADEDWLHSAGKGDRPPGFKLSDLAEEPDEPLPPSVPSGKTTYTVQVDDNFHYMDERERYTLGEYATWEEAVAAAKKIVDDYLNSSSESGGKELYDSYVSFGEDPFIVGDPPEGQSFSAWAYAKMRCDQLDRRR